MSSPPRRRQPPLPSSSPDEPPPAPPTHGDCYGELDARDDALAATTSTHGAPVDRRSEEPSEAPVDTGERLEGET